MTESTPAPNQDLPTPDAGESSATTDPTDPATEPGPDDQPHVDNSLPQPEGGGDEVDDEASPVEEPSDPQDDPDPANPADPPVEVPDDLDEAPEPADDVDVPDDEAEVPEPEEPDAQDPDATEPPDPAQQPEDGREGSVTVVHAEGKTTAPGQVKEKGESAVGKGQTKPRRGRK